MYPPHPPTITIIPLYVVQCKCYPNAIDIAHLNVLICYLHTCNACIWIVFSILSNKHWQFHMSLKEYVVRRDETTDVGTPNQWFIAIYASFAIPISTTFYFHAMVFNHHFNGLHHGLWQSIHLIII